jgi:hypothetical protein
VQDEAHKLLKTLGYFNPYTLGTGSFGQAVRVTKGPHASTSTALNLMTLSCVPCNVVLLVLCFMDHSTLNVIFHTQCIVKANRLHLLAAAQDISPRVVKIQLSSTTNLMGQEEAKVLAELRHPNVVSFYKAQTVPIEGIDVHLTEMDRLCSCARFHHAVFMCSTCTAPNPNHGPSQTGQIEAQPHHLQA